MGVEVIRKDFPASSGGMVYLDNAATVLTPKPIIDKISENYTYYRGNPLRSVHSFERRTVTNCEVMAMSDTFEYVKKVGLNEILKNDRKHGY